MTINLSKKRTLIRVKDAINSQEDRHKKRPVSRQFKRCVSKQCLAGFNKWKMNKHLSLLNTKLREIPI